MDTIEQIKRIVGSTGWVQDADEAQRYLTDWRGVYQGTAALIVRPQTTAEVAEIVKLCAQAGIPIVPQGGNTGLCAGSVPDGSGRAVVLNLARMNRVRNVDPTNFSITVEAGALLVSVQEAAAAAGLMFPLSLGAEGSCQIGGNISTNAGGMGVLKYGTMRDLTLGLEVVLPDGSVWEGLRGLRKDNTGYDLKQFFIGAEGTLGIVTAAVLRLVPRPRARVTVLAAAQDLGQGVSLFERLQSEFPGKLSAFELMSRSCIELALKNLPAAVDPFSEPHPWYLLFDLEQNAEGESEAELEAVLGTRLEAGDIEDVVIAHNLAQSGKLWYLREAIVEGERLEYGSVKHDISLPISAIVDFVGAAVPDLETRLPGIRVAVFGHVGDGNLHFNLVRPESLDRSTFLGLAAPLTDFIYESVMARSGSISAEHGIGSSKVAQLARFKSPVELATMALIKQALDPKRIMNPGKIFDAEQYGPTPGQS
jgi:FAD/FMN-containing dehydrogenase